MQEESSDKQVVHDDYEAIKWTCQSIRAKATPVYTQLFSFAQEDSHNLQDGTLEQLADLPSTLTDLSHDLGRLTAR